jgi:hypothetical protein
MKSRTRSSTIRVCLYRMFSVVSHGSRKGIVLRAGILILAIAIADWCVDPEIPLEFLCVFPVVLLGGALSRWQLGLAAGLCTFLAENVRRSQVALEGAGHGGTRHPRLHGIFFDAIICFRTNPQ